MESLWLPNYYIVRESHMATPRARGAGKGREGVRLDSLLCPPRGVAGREDLLLRSFTQCVLVEPLQGRCWVPAV